MYDVFIDHQDVKIISEIRKDFSFVKKVKYQRSFGYVPKFKLWEDNKKSNWVLCLNNPNKVCSFLKNDKCSIYENRPLICKSYPHIFVNGRVREMDNLCPIKWMLSEEKKKQIETNYNQLLINFLSFQTICDEWNKSLLKGKSFDDFLTFVNQYEN